MSADEPLPAHRIALRATIVAPIAGLSIALALTIILFVHGESFNDLHDLWFVLVATLGAATWCGLLVVSEEAARHVTRAWRPLMIGLVGAGSAAVVAAAMLWVDAVSKGRAPLDRSAELFDWIGEKPLVSSVLELATFLPFLTIGLARVSSVRVGLQLGLATAAGVAATAGFLLILRSSVELAIFAALFTLLPPVAVVGLALGARAERRLLAWFARWRAAGDDG
jgi:hypothetical protein